MSEQYELDIVDKELERKEKLKKYAKEYYKKYYKITKNRLKHNERMRKYRQRPEVKERISLQRKKYNQSPEGKQKQKEYNQRSETKQKRKEYRQRPEVKIKRNKAKYARIKIINTVNSIKDITLQWARLKKNKLVRDTKRRKNLTNVTVELTPQDILDLIPKDLKCPIYKVPFVFNSLAIVLSYRVTPGSGLEATSQGPKLSGSNQLKAISSFVLLACKPRPCFPCESEGSVLDCCACAIHRSTNQALFDHPDQGVLEPPPKPPNPQKSPARVLPLSLPLQKANFTASVVMCSLSGAKDNIFFSNTASLYILTKNLPSNSGKFLTSLSAISIDKLEFILPEFVPSSVVNDMSVSNFLFTVIL